MAIMTKMREYTKVFLVILVLAFVGTIVFDWGMDITGLRTQRGFIAKVNGTKISLEQFYDSYQQEIDNYRKRTGADPPESQLTFIRNQVWENLVRDVLVTEEISKRKIAATDKEILYYIFDRPPEFITRNPSFQTEDGKFDFGKYQATLRDPGADQFWFQVENYLRASLPYQKFQTLIDASVLVTESQVREEYLKRNQKATVRYVEFPVSRYRDREITITEEEAKAYYKDNREEFREPEKRRIEYVLFSTQPTAKDSQSVRDEAQRLLQRALAGEDFETLAQDYSEDESNRDKGGDLSFFKRGQMVKPFEEAAFAAKPGAIIGPVETRFGLHLINVVEKKFEAGEEMVHARHILLKYDASSETISSARDSANYFSSLAKETSWQETSESEQVKSQTSAFFEEGSGFVPGVGVNREASRFVFKNSIGSISDPIETPQGFLVLRIDDIQKEHIKDFEEVRTQIEAKLKDEKWRQMAHQDAEKFYAKLLQSGAASLDSLAHLDSLEVKETSRFSRSGYVSGIGRDQEFIGAAFSLSPNQISMPVKGTRGSYVLQLVDFDEFNEADYEAQKQAIRSQLVERAKQEAFSQWYAAVKEKADIKDYRDMYF